MADEDNQDENNENLPNENTDENPPKNKSQTQQDQDLIDRIVSEKVAEGLKDMKAKLDNAYKARDEALAKIKDYERKEREAEIKRLEEEGKHKEAYEAKLADERAARENLEKQNTELTRDLRVKEALGRFEFRNERSQQMAFKEICSNLVRDDSGTWKHRSGASIDDYVSAFVKEEDNSFLLKVKNSSGSGTPAPKGPSGGNGNKSIFEMSQADVLKMAAEGKLRKTNK